jgi:hypothetical protein
MEVLSIIFGAVLIIIGSVMYSPIENGAFFYIIVVGGAVLTLVGLVLFIVDMIRFQKLRKNNEQTDETEIPLELEE